MKDIAIGMILFSWPSFTLVLMPGSFAIVTCSCYYNQTSNIYIGGTYQEKDPSGGYYKHGYKLGQVFSQAWRVWQLLFLL